MSIKKCFFGSSEVETALLTVSFLLDKDHGQQRRNRVSQRGKTTQKQSLLTAREIRLSSSKTCFCDIILQAQNHHQRNSYEKNPRCLDNMMKDCLKTMTTPLARCTFFQECLHHDISLMLDTTSSFNKYAVENKWVELVVKSHNNNSTTEDSPTN